MPWWAQAILLSIVGIVFYIVMIKRWRRRNWPDAPTPSIAPDRKDTSDDSSE